MPNGEDRNVVRLTVACAQYRDRFDEWPAQIAIDPGVLWNIAMVLGSERFSRVCQRVDLCSTAGEWAPYICVEGSAGRLVYGEEEGPSRDSQDRAAEWLGV